MIDISLNEDERLSYRDIQLKLERLGVYINRTSTRLKHIQTILNQSNNEPSQLIEAYLNRQQTTPKIEVKK